MYKIYIKDITDESDVSHDQIKFLPKDCISEVIKYKQPNDIKQSFYAWELLLNKLNTDFNYSINNFKFKKNKYNKPYIDSNIYFNISHSNNMIIAVISDTEIGVDIELNNKNINHIKFLNKIFKNKIIKPFNYIKTWTKYEAYYKMLGTGILTFENFNKNIFFSAKLITKKIKDKKNNKYYYSICIKNKIN